MTRSGKNIRQDLFFRPLDVEPPEKDAARVLNDALTCLANDQEIKADRE